MKFVRYARERGLRFADEIARPFAEGYARWLNARVTTYAKHIGTLRREWSLLFPDSTSNPWNLGIKLQPREKAKAMNYRVITFNEFQRVRQVVARLSADPSLTDTSRLRILTPGLLEDIADALVISYRYGLRIGSVAAIRRSDFNLAAGTFTHRPPKTSRATLGMDYPILPEILAILRRRGLRGRGPQPSTSPTSQPPNFELQTLNLKLLNSHTLTHSNSQTSLLPFFSLAYFRSEQQLNLAVKRIFRMAGVNDHPLRGRASWHSLRATFITRLTEAGCPHPIVRELAQHVRADVTSRYIHTSMAVKLQWLSRIQPAGPIDPDADYPTEPELSPRRQRG